MMAPASMAPARPQRSRLSNGGGGGGHVDAAAALSAAFFDASGAVALGGRWWTGSFRRWTRGGSPVPVARRRHEHQRPAYDVRLNPPLNPPLSAQTSGSCYLSRQPSAFFSVPTKGVGSLTNLPTPQESRLELALLHAAPLVWKHEGRLAPLDGASLSLDFKSEVRAMWDMLGARRSRCRCVDIASSATLGELLALKPARSTVCHADYEPHKPGAATHTRRPSSSASRTRKARSPALTARLKALLAPALVRSTRLVFISAPLPARSRGLVGGVPQ